MRKTHARSRYDKIDFNDGSKRKFCPIQSYIQFLIRLDITFDYFYFHQSNQIIIEFFKRNINIVSCDSCPTIIIMDFN